MIDIYGWGINLTGSSIPVYAMDTNPTERIGTLTPNECFAEGTMFDAAYEGWGTPVFFKNAAYANTFGAVDSSYESGLMHFKDYASDGTSWVKVSTLKRRVVSPTVAYYQNGTKCCDLPIGSYVWLTNGCTRGQNNPTYVSVSKVQLPDGTIHSFSPNGFINLAHGDRWLNVSSILLRKV